MTAFFARLVGGVFLRARIAQHMAERSGKIQRALLAMQDGRHLPARHLALEAQKLGRFIGEVVLDVIGLQSRDHVVRDEVRGVRIEVIVEVDVLLIERIPEVIVRGRDDLVEGRRAVQVPVDVQHLAEIGRRDRVVHLVLSDLADWSGGIGHRVVSPG